MPTIEIIGQSAQDDDNRPAATSRLVNCYREGTGERTGRTVKSVLGTEEFAQLNGVYIRALQKFGNTLYAAHGGRLHKISESAEIQTLGDINNAFTTMATLDDKIAIAAGGEYYVYGSSLTRPTVGIFENVGSICEIAGRIILTEEGGDRLAWSEVADPETIDGLSFGSVRQRDDRIVRAFPIGGELWVFNDDTTERWYYSDGTLSFEYMPGSLIERGLKAKNLICKIPEGAFLVGSDGKAHIAAGGRLTPVSSVAVETAISKGKAVACVHYQDEGHEFAGIIFEDRPAWFLDISTGEWHERASLRDAFKVRATVGAWGSFYGVQHDGKMCRFTRNNRDGEEPLIREMTGKTLRNEGRYFRVSELRINGRQGAVSIDDTYNPAGTVLEAENGALDAEEGLLEVSRPGNTYREPQITLEVSDDWGHNWSDAYFEGMGRLGEHTRNIEFRGLGQFEQFTPRITISEPVEFPIDAQIDVRIS